jgi:hypothetical protein
LGIDGGLGDLEEDNDMNEDMDDIDNSEESKMVSKFKNAKKKQTKPKKD